jgi:CRISPR-associated exonuclease Cas4
VYYIELTDLPALYPTWVRQGEQFHEREARLWQRRNLTRFNITGGKIHLNVSAHSDMYGIHGIADMAVETDDSIIPVEFKLASSKQKKGGILQLAAYGILLGETLEKKCAYGFLAEGERILHKIDFTPLLKEEVFNKIYEIRKMINKGVKPDSSANMQQCSNCEYLNHCNDRG